MFNSSSFFNIDADKKLSRLKMKAFILLNKINNSLPLVFLNGKLSVKNFSLSEKELDFFWPLTETKSSPSRKLSDFFWLSLPWQKIENELEKINIFDSGCGSGNYGKFFINRAGAVLENYFGVDLFENKNWPILEKEFSNFHFSKTRSDRILSFIPENSNLFISQSAIEHFEKDLLFFKQIRKFILTQKKPVLQIHLFPSAACLRLYRGHGFRQYTERTIQKITRLFSDFSDCFLFNLGGENCNNLHFNFITKPRLSGKPDRRDLETESYDRLLKESVKKDMALKENHSPSFYALIIHSFKKKIIFDD